MRLAPPYRLRTREEVRAFAGASPSNSRRAMLRFAEREDLVEPQLLRSLPERVFVPRSVTTVRLRRREESAVDGRDGLLTVPPGTRADLVRAALDPPPTYLEAMAAVVEGGRGFVRRVSPSGEAGAAPAGRLGPVHRMLALHRELPEVLSAALRAYLNTRREDARSFLSRSLVLLALYRAHDRGPAGSRELDRELAARIRRLDPTVTGLPAAVLHSLRVRLTNIRSQVLRTCLPKFLSRFREDVHRVSGLPANLKTNAFALMGQVADGTKTSDRARGEVERVLQVFEKRLDEPSVRRFRSVVENFLEKAGASERLFDAVLGEGTDLPGTAATELVAERRVIDPEFLSLYPTKDYHDFLKGQASGDCTVEESRAVAQLSHPRFFNIRIFHRSGAWVGNIYALDFTDAGTVIVDKIQVRRPEVHLPEPLLGDLLERLGRDLFAPLSSRVLMPAEGVSNASSIAEEFRLRCRGRRRVRFQLGAGEDCFESARRRTFVILKVARFGAAS